MLIKDCKLDPARLGVLAECMQGDPQEGEWPEQLLSAQTVAYSCGILARRQDAVVHAHDPQELQLCQRLAGEVAQIMKDVLIGGNDEGDHTLDPFYVPANCGDAVPQRIDEKAFRTAMRGVVHPKAKLTFEAFAKTSGWWTTISKVNPDLASDPDELKRVGQWGQLFDWFVNNKELHGPVYIGFEETDGAPATAYPKLWVGLTAAGSLVGVLTCVVWT
jgi:hypothetical protein